ncbi:MULTISPECIES: DUF4190 domain-containing protein [Stenotrophomonas]|jgi:hypothetical protein|uniref:DUF4190 domain-containing protein n=1 Tax=Stenotrophomonas TaxID=40323 RepID=UPI000456A8B7|nr:MULTISPECIES: DUF4190 domain-containing protein [Stenotrophomonas]AHY59253.1 membrane protein [Stenotrophomonas rhizophila]MDY0953117.1 DUF4190 domain-containing protein [Stenotrophomonas rhizophila]QHB71194.1 DUF4190 domain-containing protein [Stenotrophomonas sp. 364]TKK09374.1 DUF4190 domain-containing protein [Stenotrophomonas rhizophila]
MNQPYRQTSSLAVVSLIMGIVGWTVFPFLGSLIAIVTGHMARAEIRRQPQALEGDGLAVAGLVLGWLAVIGSILVVVGFVLFFGGLALFAASQS